MLFSVVGELKFQFAVKFYEPEPGKHLDEYTRYCRVIPAKKMLSASICLPFYSHGARCPANSVKDFRNVLKGDEAF